MSTTIRCFAGVSLLSFFFLLPMHAEWKKTNGPFAGAPAAVACTSSELYAAVNGVGVYRSSDHGSTWTNISQGVTNLTFRTMTATDDNNVYLGTTGGVFVSTDKGEHWTTSAKQPGVPDIRAIVRHKGYLFAGALGAVYRSADNGATWTKADSGISRFHLQVTGMAASGTSIVVISVYGAYHSEDAGMTWRYASPNVNGNPASLVCVGQDFFSLSNTGLFRSADQGAQWTRLNTPITQYTAVPLVQNEAELMTITASGVIRITNRGDSLVAVTNGVPISAGVLVANGMNLYVVGAYGVMASADNGVHWEKASGLTDAYVGPLASIGNTLVAGTPEGIFRSVDGGREWVLANTGLTNDAISDLAVIGSMVFAGTSRGGVFGSADSGQTWMPRGAGVVSPSVYGLSVSGTNLIAVTDSWGTFLSVDLGEAWKPINLHSGTGPIFTTMGGAGATLIGGMYGTSNYLQRGASPQGPPHAGLYRSKDLGTTWTQITTPWSFLTYVRMIAPTPTAFYLSTDSYVDATPTPLYSSVDDGLTWQTADPSGQLGKVETVVSVNNVILAGTLTKGIYRSAGSGLPWTAMNAGLTSTRVNDIVSVGSNCYIATDHGVWSRSLSEITSIEGDKPTPSRYTLDQNYPNPFNPTTTIAYGVVLPGHVRLTVYDVLGREVATLVDEAKAIGNYTVKFDARRFASGMYLYRLEAGSFSAVRKMQMVK